MAFSLQSTEAHDRKFETQGPTSFLKIEKKKKDVLILKKWKHSLIYLLVLRTTV